MGHYIKKYWKRTGFFILIVLLLGSTIKVSGDGDDPLITLSYLNKRLAEINVSDIEVQSDSSTSGMIVVECDAGEEVIGASGTEIILRSGEATAIASENGGLSDVTVGKDLGEGIKIESNHLLYVPRSDGRGVKAKTNAIFIVRGTYQIKK